MKRLVISAGLALWSFAGIAYAEAITITPVLIESSDVVQRALDENAGHASTSVSGNGAFLSLGYSANEPITVFLVPLKSDNTYATTDFVRFTLPAAEEGDVLVDLTVSPGWSPGEQKYLVNMLSKSADASAAFTRLDFVPGSFFGDIGAGLGHLFTPEPYLPSSYHALHGYRIFGHEVSLWFGILCVLAAIIAAVMRPKGAKLSALLIVLIAGNMAYSLRFALDELSFTTTHLDEYSHSMYDEAGSVHLIAEVLSFMADDPKAVIFVCRDGTNFKEKLLRYFAYPLKITSDPADAPRATHVLVMDKRDWSLDTAIDSDGSRQTLRCGPITHEGEKTTTFEDGSMLFRFPAAQ